MEMIKIYKGRLFPIMGGLFILFSILFAPFCLSDETYATTNVTVYIPSLVYGLGDTLVVAIICSPGQSIKAYECSLTYDPSVLSIESVTEGNIFSGYDTFYNNGTIDNTAGELNDVFSVIVGSGNVTDSGSLIIVTFEAIGSGIAWINLTDVGITDETSYLSVSLSNDSCEIDSDSPNLTDVSRSSSSPLDTDPTYGWVNISCNATDTNGIDTVSLEILCPNSTMVYRSCSRGSGDIWYYNTSDIFITHGNFSYILNATDTNGNSQTSSAVDFSMPANWDIDMNGICNVFDFTLVANIYEDSGDAGWTREDVDNNGDIGLLDLVSLSNHYGDSWYN